jgi:hypothetical protein
MYTSPDSIKSAKVLRPAEGHTNSLWPIGRTFLEYLVSRQCLLQTYCHNFNIYKKSRTNHALYTMSVVAHELITTDIIKITVPVAEPTEVGNWLTISDIKLSTAMPVFALHDGQNIQK